MPLPKASLVKGSIPMVPSPAVVESRPLSAIGTPASTDSHSAQRCVHCRSLKFAFSRTFALGTYRGVLRDGVILAKQSGRRVVASALASLAVESHRDAILACGCELVCPIPSHWLRRLKRRGTPAQVLAETFAHDLGLPFRSLLRRVRPTEKQGTLTPVQRRKNVDGSFAENRGYVFPSAVDVLRDKHILLVDDVLTTGATGNAAAAALIRAGAREVTMAVIARATG